jgi:CRP-like cAMP-binding protein
MVDGDLATFLGRTLLFDGLEPDELDRLAGISRTLTVAPGDALFEQGEESDGLYVIITGIVRIYLTADDGREATISLLEDGEVIGEIALLDGLPRSAGAAALTETQLVFIPHGPFCGLLDSSGRLARQIILTLCERLRAANAQVDQAIFHDLRHRLMVLLHQIALIHGRVESGMAVVDLDLTQGALARMLGASREAVNKHLRALAREGRIAVDGHKIRLFKVARQKLAVGQEGETGALLDSGKRGLVRNARRRGARAPGDGTGV